MNRRLLLGSWPYLLATPLFAALVGAATTSTGGAVSAREAGGGWQAKKSVLSGVYTVEQAKRGEAAYRQECSGCHMDDLMGDGIAPALVGSPFYFRWSDLSVADMMTAIRTTMPQGAPASLSPQMYADIISYLFKSNKLPAGSTELPPDASELQDVMIEQQASK